MENTANKQTDAKTNPVVVIGAIIVAVIVLLFVMNLILGAKILENSGASFDDAFEVLSGADSFTKMDVATAEVDGVTIKSLVEAENGAGKVATVTVKGYGDPMDIVVGVAGDGTISGVKVLENTETQGIGSKAVDAEHTSLYIGKSGDTAVEAVAGATISSDAVNNAVKVAYDTLTAAQ